jgi:site-specific recombinase XerD
MSSDKFYLQKRPKVGTYYLVIVSNVNGKRQFKKVSCKTKNKTEALRFLKNYEKNLQEPVINPDLKISDAERPILEYAKNNLSNGSYEKYKIVFKLLQKVFGNRKVISIKEKDAEHFKSALIKTIKKETANSYIRYVKSIWNLMKKLELISINNLRDVKQFKIPEKEIISFTEVEIDLIINKIPHQDIKTIVTLAKETGLRISELLNLKTKNIDLENKFIKVSNSEDFKTKSGKNRLIPFNDKIELLINSVLKPDKEGYLFTSKWNIPYKRNHVTRYFRRILDELNFDKRYHFHCLRATFIMNLVRKGINPIIIQKLAGHSTLTVTQRYCFVQINDLRQALNT